MQDNTTATHLSEHKLSSEITFQVSYKTYVPNELTKGPPKVFQCIHVREVYYQGVLISTRVLKNQDKPTQDQLDFELQMYQPFYNEGNTLPPDRPRPQPKGKSTTEAPSERTEISIQSPKEITIYADNAEMDIEQMTDLLMARLIEVLKTSNASL
jgi:hypothetical protein